VVVHQRNSLRLAELRQKSASLDDTIKSTIRLLAETRKDIQAIAPIAAAEESSSGPSTAGAQVRKTLQVKDVLDYAKFISKTSVPPTYRKPAPDSTVSSAAPPATPAGPTNGIVTPMTAQDETFPILPGATDSTVEPPSTAAQAALPSDSKQWLDPTTALLPFEPWPSHQVISSGALAAIQRMVESGQDPASVLSAEELAEAEVRKAEEEERERIAAEERERRRREAFGDGPVGGAGGGGGGGAFNPDDL
jgi:signal transduction histidine kinase